MQEEGFVISFRGNADEAVDASKQAASGISNVIKAAAKLGQTDAFKSLTSSAQKAATNISEIGSGLSAFKVDYSLPDFAPLTRLVTATQKDINKTFTTALPQPEVSGFVSAVLGAVNTAQKSVANLQNTKIDMGAVKPPNLEPLRAAVAAARDQIEQAAVIQFPPITPPPAITIPPADTSKFEASIRTVQAVSKQANVTLHSFESVQVPAIVPPDLKPLERAITEGRTFIERTFLNPLPTTPFQNLSKEVQVIINGLKAQDIQIPFAIQKPDLSAIHAGVEAAKKGIVSDLTLTIPPVQVPPIPAPKTTGYEAAVKSAISLINDLSRAASSVTTAVKPPDLSGYKNAIQVVRNDLQTAALVKVPGVDAKDFFASIAPLDKALANIQTEIERVGALPIQAPAIQPPSLVPLTQSVTNAKNLIQSIGTLKMPEVQPPVVPPLDFRAFKASSLSIRDQVALINGLFSGISDTPIQAPSLVPFDTRPLQKAVDVSKKLLAETANLSLPTIDTPDLKPVNTAPYLFSLETAKKGTTDAAKILQSVSTLQLTAPVIPAPSLVPIETAIADIRKEVSGIQLTLPKVQAPPITPIAAPKIDLADFVHSTDDLQVRVKQINAILKGVDAKDVPAPTILPIDVRPLQQTVAEIQKQIADVRFAQIQFPKIEPLVVPPVDKSLFDQSTSALQKSVVAVNSILAAASDTPIQAPAILPPDLQPLRNAVKNAQATIESVRLIRFPEFEVPAVPSLNERNFDSSVTGLASKIKYINGLFTQISDTPINAPALIPFNTQPLTDAVNFVKKQLAEASRLTIPQLSTPEIPGMDVRAFDKGLTHLQQSVQAANDFLKQYGAVHLVAPILPTPDLQPLFSAVETAKDNIKRSGTIVLPKVQIPTLEPVKVPPLVEGEFVKSVNDLQVRVQAVNNLLHEVDTTPIAPPAIQPLNTKPLYTTITDVQEKIKGISFTPITLPSIPPLTVPAVIADAFNRSALQVEGRAKEMQSFLTAVSIEPVVIPTPVVPDISAVKNWVNDIKERISLVKDLPGVHIEAVTVEPINLIPFNNSIAKLDASVVGVHNILHAITTDPIVPPAIRPPDLSALRDAVDAVRKDIQQSAAIQLPDVQAPKLIAPDTAPLVKGVQLAKDAITTIWQKPVPAPTLDISAPKVSALPLPFPVQPLQMPDFKPLIKATDNAKDHLTNLEITLEHLRSRLQVSTDSNIIKGIEKNIDKVQAKIDNFKGIKINVPVNIIPPPNVPTIIPPKFAIPVPDTALFQNTIAKMVADAKNTIDKTFVTAIPPLDDPFKDVRAGIDDTIKRSQALQEQLNTIRKLKGADMEFLVKTSVEKPNFSDLKNAVKVAQKSIDKVTIHTIPTIKDPFAKVKKGAADASNVLVDLSRIASDAPFGFIAIQNNIQPLLDSFRRLRAESGSNLSALKAMAGGLIGPAGLGLAISAVSGLFLVFGDKIFNSKSKIDQFREAQEKAKQATEDFVASLSDVARARLTGAQNAQSELVQVQTLYAATQNTNLALTERKKAVDALQSQYPKYFANIKDETILAGGATDAYNKLATAILASARARAAQDAIVELQKQSLVLEQQRATVGQQALDLALKLKQAQAGANANAAGAAQSQFAALQVTKGIAKAQTAYNDKLRESATIAAQIDDIQRRSARLAGDIQLNVETNGVDTLIGKVKEAKDATKGDFGFFDKFFSFSPNAINLTEKQIGNLLDAARAFRKEFGSGTGLRVEMPDFEVVSGQKGLDAARKFWKDFTSGVVRLVPPTIELDFNVVPKFEKDPLDLLPRYLDSLREEAERKAGKFIEIPFGIKPTLDAQTLDINNFSELGKSIGGTLGTTAGDVFSNIFRTALFDAVNVQKLTGEALQRFKESFVIGSQLSSQFFGGLVDGVGAFTSALLDGGDAMQAFGNSLINIFKKLAVQLAETAALAALLSLISGATGTPIPFFKAFKSILGGGKLPGFANGGFVVPPGFANDGFNARLSSGEAVIPLNRLNDFLAPQAQPQVIVVHERLRGTDVVRQISRTNKSNRRTG